MQKKCIKIILYSVRPDCFQAPEAATFVGPD